MARHSDHLSTSPRRASMQASPSVATDEDSASFSSFPSGRWRVVSAWTSLRRHLDSPRSSKTSSPNTSSTFNSAARAGGALEGQSGVPTNTPTSELPAPLTKRKRVSLFLKRRRSAQPFCRSDATDTRYVQDTRLVVSSTAVSDKSDGTQRELNDASLCRLKRRVRSTVADANISNYMTRADIGGSSIDAITARKTFACDNGKDAGNQNEMSSSRDDSFDGLTTLRLMAAAADAGMRHSNRSSIKIASDDNSRDGTVSVTLLRGADLEQSGEGDDGGDDEIVGAICLEDFADDEPDGDYAFLDGLSVEMSADRGIQDKDNGSSNDPFAQEGSSQEVVLDASSVRWIADEREFAKFFAQVGVNVDDLFDADEEQQLSEFCVDDHVIDEWRAAGEEHNQRCLTWSFSNLCVKNTTKRPSKPNAVGGSVSPIDIRQLAAEFCPCDIGENRR